VELSEELTSKKMRFPPSKKEKRIPLSAASDEIKMDKIIQGPALSPWKDSCINSPNTSVAQFLKSSPDTTKPVLLDDSVSRQRVRGEKRRKQALVPHGQELFSKRRCSASRRGFSPNFPAGWMFDKATKGYSPTVGTSLLTYSPRLFEDLILEKPSDVVRNMSFPPCKVSSHTFSSGYECVWTPSPKQEKQSRQLFSRRVV